LISPAALAPVENTHGDVINAPPAKAPPFRNLRLSTAIPHSPLAPDKRARTQVSDHAEARCFRQKISKTGSSAVNTKVTAAPLDPKNKKARQTLAGLSGYLARAKPASSMVRRRRKRFSLHDR
jgi:hypothetical protein